MPVCSLCSEHFQDDVALHHRRWVCVAAQLMRAKQVLIAAVADVEPCVRHPFWGVMERLGFSLAWYAADLICAIPDGRSELVAVQCVAIPSHQRRRLGELKSWLQSPLPKGRVVLASPELLLLLEAKHLDALLEQIPEDLSAASLDVIQALESS